MRDAPGIHYEEKKDEGEELWTGAILEGEKKRSAKFSKNLESRKD